MQQPDFEAMLAEEQFGEVMTVERKANASVDTHTHPFDAKALVLEGELSIGWEGREQLYRAGDIFHLAAHTPHTERYGPEGVKYVVGRK